jgi:hypothetical protein
VLPELRRTGSDQPGRSDAKSLVCPRRSADSSTKLKESRTFRHRGRPRRTSAPGTSPGTPAFRRTPGERGRVATRDGLPGVETAGRPRVHVMASGRRASVGVQAAARLPPVRARVMHELLVDQLRRCISSIRLAERARALSVFAGETSMRNRSPSGPAARRAAHPAGTSSKVGPRLHGPTSGARVHRLGSDSSPRVSRICDVLDVEDAVAARSSDERLAPLAPRASIPGGVMVDRGWCYWSFGAAHCRAGALRSSNRESILVHRPRSPGTARVVAAEGHDRGRGYVGLRPRPCRPARGKSLADQLGSASSRRCDDELPRSSGRLPWTLSRRPAIASACPPTPRGRVWNAGRLAALGRELGQQRRRPLAGRVKRDGKAPANAIRSGRPRKPDGRRSFPDVAGSFCEELPPSDGGLRRDRHLTTLGSLASLVVATRYDSCPGIPGAARPGGPV